MKKLIKKSNNAPFYIFIGVVILAGLAPVAMILGWVGSTYFYARYAPIVCIDKLTQTNLVQPPVQIGSSWNDGASIYFVPQEMYVKQGGYLYFAKNIDKSQCQQYLTVKGSLIFRQDTIDTPIHQSVLTVDVELIEPTQGTEPYLITNILQKTFLPFAPTIDIANNSRAMKFSRTIFEKSSDDPMDLVYKHGSGMISEINGKSTDGETISIMQVNGTWNVRNDTQ